MWGLIFALGAGTLPVSSFRTVKVMRFYGFAGTSIFCTRGWNFAGIFFSDSQSYEILWVRWDIYFLNIGSDFTRYLIK